MAHLMGALGQHFQNGLDLGAEHIDGVVGRLRPLFTLLAGGQRLRLHTDAVDLARAQILDCAEQIAELVLALNTRNLELQIASTDPRNPVHHSTDIGHDQPHHHESAQNSQSQPDHAQNRAHQLLGHKGALDFITGLVLQLHNFRNHRADRTRHLRAQLIKLIAGQGVQLLGDIHRGFKSTGIDAHIVEDGLRGAGHDLAIRLQDPVQHALHGLKL